ncbi:MAG: hypothetical protein ACR2LP_03695 [Candidatus Limnocylindrales bacterium]
MGRTSLLGVVAISLVGWSLLTPLAIVQAAAPGRGGAAPDAPDFNGDGYADLAVSAPKDDIAAKDGGAVHVILGSSAGLTATGDQLWTQDSAGILEEAEEGDRFGRSLATGDFDADGYTDLAVGAFEDDGGDNAGGVNVIYGSPGGLTAADDQYWSQDSPGIGGTAEPLDKFGWALTGGDFDGDGFEDLAISALWEGVGAVTKAGSVTVLYGSSTGLRAAGDQVWTQDSPGIAERADGLEDFGWALSAADFDGDGFDDLAVGAPYEDYHDHRDGGVHVIRGSPGGLTANGSQFWSQDSPGILNRAYLREQFGQSLAAGDFDGDGFGDLAVGVWFQDFCRICNNGAANVIYGSADGLAAEGNQFWSQRTPGVPDPSDGGDQFGNALATGDFDADGFTDLAVGVPREDLYDDDIFQDRGLVNVILGSSGGLTADGSQAWTQDSPGIRGRTEPGDLFGISLGAADFDGNGATDLAIGVRFEDLRDKDPAGTRKDAGALNVIYGSSADGLRATGNQYWTQDTPGIRGTAEAGDWFGYAPSTEWPASGSTGPSRGTDPGG